MSPVDSGAWYENQDLLFALGAIAWLLAMLATWPDALSFGDEIGYLGQAKLFLEGHVHPTPGAPGIWNPTPAGDGAQYPLLPSLLIAPLFALAPGAIFLSGAAAAIALAWVAGRILKSWNISPCWGLLFLAHPTVVILARTVMSDLLLAAFALGAWWSLRNRRLIATVLLVSATMATRPTGVLIAGAIIAGEVLDAWRTGRAAGQPARAAAKAPLQVGGLSFLAGLVAVAVTNLLSTGTLRSGYSFHKDLHPFALAYFATSAPAHAGTLLLNPPLLLAGLLPHWRRRLSGPLLVIGGLTLMMSFYFFVDSGRSRAETLVIAPRLILPVVIFLLIGYAALLARLAARLRVVRLAAILLVIAPAGIAWKIGARHQAWQRPMRDARWAAAGLARQVGASEIGLSFLASKAGMLFGGKTTWIVPDGPRPAVLLCCTHGNSYRSPTEGIPDEERCEPPGYHRVRTLDGYVLMLRDGIPLPASLAPS